MEINALRYFKNHMHIRDNFSLDRYMFPKLYVTLWNSMISKKE